MVSVPLLPVQRLRGHPALPHDKSISHRALMLAAVCHGTSTLRHVAQGEDVARTRAALVALGAAIEPADAQGVTRVVGTGPGGLHDPGGPVDCGNSGTTLRLLMGLLSGLNLGATLVGDASLSRRPMNRIAAPLGAMGARCTLTDHDRAPVVVHPTRGLRGVEHTLTLASGQLKGALLLAGLHAAGTTTLRGALAGRDHTERLLRTFGAKVGKAPGCITFEGGQRLRGAQVLVPQDFSAAAFWLGAGLLVDDSDIILTPVGLNPTRTGLLQALQEMGANISCTTLELKGEPFGTLRVRNSARSRQTLHGITLGGSRIAPMIDELPLLMVLATQAQGTTVVQDAHELRVKETDRLEAMTVGLRRMGANITQHPGGCTIEGPTPLTATTVQSFGDHRVAMALSVAAMVCPGPSTLEGAECMAVSDPHFLATRAMLQRADLTEEYAP